jgi:RimJ/RimL family protein N-acetyltransferase
MLHSKTKKSIVETRAWLQARLKDPSKPWINVLAIVAKPSEQTDPHAKPKAIGMVGVPRLFRDESELGYGLHPDFWGRGLATEAVNAFLKVHFKDPNASGLMALVHCEHWGSSKVLEKLGFVEVDREEEDVVYKLQRTAFEERNKLE